MLTRNFLAAEEGSLFAPAQFGPPDLGEPLHVAQADTPSAESEAPVSEECRALLLDTDAEVIDIIRKVMLRMEAWLNHLSPV